MNYVYILVENGKKQKKVLMVKFKNIIERKGYRTKCNNGQCSSYNYRNEIKNKINLVVDEY